MKINSIFAFMSHPSTAIELSEIPLDLFDEDILCTLDQLDPTGVEMLVDLISKVSKVRETRTGEIKVRYTQRTR